MPWNGGGVFTRVFSWISDAAAGIDISASRMDQDTDDITANGFGNCLTRDGQGVATANLPMAGFRHTGASNGANRNDYAALGQVEDGTVNWISGGGTADAITATYNPAITALIDGQFCFFRATSANATTTPNFSPNGLTAAVITKNGGAPLVAGDIPASLAEVVIRYSLANNRWELLNPAGSPVVTAGGDLSGTFPNPTVVATHLTSALPVGQGGTGAVSAAAALLSLGAAPLASPTFTGSPSGPTPPLNNNSTRFLTTAGFMNAFANTLAAAGSQTFPGGLIIKWGGSTGANNSFTTISFPTPFPNNCFGVVATGNNASETNHLTTGNYTASSFGLSYAGSVAASGSGFWVAIGN